MIRIIYDETVCDVRQFTHNDGSVHVEIAEEHHNGILYANSVSVCAKILSPEDQMALLMASRLVSHIPDRELLIPFTPYGRQDCAFLPGQVNAMKIWGELINSLGYTVVTIVDPHSIACEFIDNVNVVKAEDIISTNRSEFDTLYDISNYTLVSPDAGANKKSHAICKKLNIPDMVRADKRRELSTGKIIETVLYGDVEGKDCIIIDDICDGGMTFIKLAEVLQRKGANRIVLFVTHGLFSKGLKVFEGLIDEVITTNSVFKDSRNIREGYSGSFSLIEM